MQHITSITAEANQRFQLVLENNETVDFRLYYLVRQQSWYYDLKYKDLTINSSRIVLTPNSLRQFKRIIPFGIAFYSDGNAEPFDITDFSSDRVIMYVLNSDEVKQVEAEIYNV